MSLAATLDACLAEAFRRLSGGVADRRSAFHTPTLATIGSDGAPEARTLVLRGFDPAAREIRLHTDARSGKAAALARDSRCQLHVYDRAAQLQLRIAGHAALLDDDVAEAAWQASRASARMCYAVQPGPGTAVPAPPPGPRNADGGRPWFRVILLRFHRLDWLELSAEGHRRARFAWQDAGPPEACWLVP